MSLVAEPRLGVEDRLIALLQRRRAVASDGEDAKELDRTIVELIGVELKDDLRHILFAKHGAKIDHRHPSVQFTELLQRFCVKVLERCPSGLLKVQTRTELLRYVAHSLSNMVREHYRSKQCHAGHYEAIGVLAKVREHELRRDCPEIALADMLDQLDKWDASDRPRERLWAAAVRYYYMVGMPYGRIDEQLHATEKMTFEKLGAQLGVSRSSAQRLCVEALEQLRKKLSV
jgi:hypothetical protein